MRALLLLAIAACTDGADTGTASSSAHPEARSAVAQVANVELIDPPGTYRLWTVTLHADPPGIACELAGAPLVTLDVYTLFSSAPRGTIPLSLNPTPVVFPAAYASMADGAPAQGEVSITSSAQRVRLLELRDRLVPLANVIEPTAFRERGIRGRGTGGLRVRNTHRHDEHQHHKQSSDHGGLPAPRSWRNLRRPRLTGRRARPRNRTPPTCSRSRSRSSRRARGASAQKGSFGFAEPCDCPSDEPQSTHSRGDGKSLRLRRACWLAG
ncbi:MAG: hypothetical protein JWP01_1112 [Myxococcales bacterium]|nr:hypothetical protein [Myxococcales bacterium]